ncbi:hypothetical protein CFIO01_01977 [Colletotrichum fioriniae PJ7]|uniref:Uncharacterized protein n=1 Tax=Colletotrichum fioriniae PJ7 TaxID=1445577 RepID=A0A010R9U8_9PEZI|nr:hypothetical protein CFIO01_01977 [Colletotrichum fioriniae PJ7]
MSGRFWASEFQDLFIESGLERDQLQEYLLLGFRPVSERRMPQPQSPSGASDPTAAAARAKAMGTAAGDSAHEHPKDPRIETADSGPKDVGLVNDMYRTDLDTKSQFLEVVIVGSAVAAAAASRRYCRKGGAGRPLSGSSTGYWAHVEVIVTHFDQ